MKNKFIDLLLPPSFGILAFYLSACDITEDQASPDTLNDAMVTSATDSLVYYYPMIMDSIDINVRIPKGPSIDYVFVEKVLITDYSVSNKAPLWKIRIGGKNITAVIDTTGTFSYADLRDGLKISNQFPDLGDVPADDTWLQSGYYWNIFFITFLTNGKTVYSNPRIRIMVN